jgi:lysyl-tRNA synthetase class 2
MEDSLREERLKKLTEIKSEGIDPYPTQAARDFSLSEARAKFEDGKVATIAGRIISIRDQGNIIFVDLKDGGGSFQLVLKKETTDRLDFWRKNLDRGDFISARGKFFTTQRGEKSLEAKEVNMLSKALLPIPSEHYGVSDVETRLRKRYLDLLVNPETKELFLKKALFWKTIRNYMEKKNFLEVETAVLEEVPGGAEAEPFQTHLNALDQDFYLRISLELPLKRLIVGGLDSVFEIGRIFRNEGIDREHLQDYTQMEFYWAYHDYRDLMKITQDLFKKTVKAVTGGTKTTYQGKELDWGAKWPKVDYVKIFKKETGLDPRKSSEDKLAKYAEEMGIRLEPNTGKGKIIDLIYKKAVRPKLIQPCFLINPPVEIEPLAKRSPKDQRVVERMQIVAGGTELGKGFTELNDPLDQRARFEEQMKLREAGDSEAQRIDEDYIEALEYGMPPTAGFGMSERLFAVLMDKTVREAVLFPLMRRKN